MECPFAVGQKVICVDPENPMLVAGAIYTVTTVALGFHDRDGWIPGIGVAEITPPPAWGPGVWDARNFRPAVDLLAEFLAGASRQKPRQKTRENV